MYTIACAIARMEGESLYITEFTQMDLKGYVPTKLMNMVLAAMSKESVGELYKSLQKIEV